MASAGRLFSSFGLLAVQNVVGDEHKFIPMPAGFRLAPE